MYSRLIQINERHVKQYFKANYTIVLRGLFANKAFQNINIFSEPNSETLKLTKVQRNYNGSKIKKDI